MQNGLTSDNPRDQIRLIELYDNLQQRSLAERKAKVTQATTRKRAYEIEQCRQQGKQPTQQLPHPDDISINDHTNEVIYNGPVNEVEKAKWDAELTSAIEAQTELHCLTLEQAKAAEPATYDKHIDALKREIARIKRTYPTELVRRVPGFNLEIWRKQQAKWHHAQRCRQAAAQRTSRKKPNDGSS